MSSLGTYLDRSCVVRFGNVNHGCSSINTQSIFTAKGNFLSFTFLFFSLCAWPGNILYFVISANRYESMHWPYTFKEMCILVDRVQGQLLIWYMFFTVCFFRNTNESYEFVWFECIRHVGNNPSIAIIILFFSVTITAVCQCCWYAFYLVDLGWISTPVMSPKSP